MDEATVKIIQETIRSTVNGKIDDIRTDLYAHNVSHEADMKRIIPVVEAYESAQNGGKFLMKTAGAITILGSAWIAAKQIFPGL